MKDLASDVSVILKPADKGGAIVVLDTTDYMCEAYRQLNDTCSYLRIAKDPIRSIMNIIKTTLQEALALDYIDKNLFDYLMVDFPRVPYFYLLPKIHKPGHPGRPIVAAQGSVTEKISRYLDFLLQPHVAKMHTYIRDTGDFISKTEGIRIPENAMILSLDVVSLYT